MSKLSGATYSRAGLLLLTRDGINDPCSIDVSRTTQSAQDDESRSADTTETDDPFASEVCAVCKKPAPPGEYIEYPTHKHGLCWAHFDQFVAIAKVMAAAARFVPRKCPVRVVETVGEELAS